MEFFDESTEEIEIPLEVKKEYDGLPLFIFAIFVQNIYKTAHVLNHRKLH